MTGRNPASLILGETLVGLTDRKANPIHGCKGSPRMLQVWLMERLHVLALVEAGQPFSPTRVTTRSKNWAGPSGHAEGYFTSFLRERPIRWVVSWWGIMSMTVSTFYGTSRGYTICSFDLEIRLHPWRLLRQFGRIQKIPPIDTEMVEPVVLTDDSIEDWARRWADRRSWTVRGTAESTRVTDAYLKWIVTTDVRVRDRQRQKELFEPRPSAASDFVCHSRDYSNVIPAVWNVPSDSVFSRLGHRPGVRDRFGSRVEEPPARDRLPSEVVAPERKDEPESSRDAKRRRK
ncbi:hypothetical protein RND81_02G147500 [Saponaria officinalis]|uniref:Aminotransferase-like plant mobile domain-containing protein n=1 Tax=Saponaria officinalis TaxID=3572 RepID=A0AAW1MLL9_SAPOF